MSCGAPLSTTVKSSFVRPAMGRPERSTTRTSTATTVAVERKTCDWSRAPVACVGGIATSTTDPKAATRPAVTFRHGHDPGRAA